MVKTSPSNAGSVGLIPGGEPEVPHITWPKKLKTQNRNNIVNKFNKHFKNDPHQKKKSYKGVKEQECVCNGVSICLVFV